MSLFVYLKTFLVANLKNILLKENKDTLKKSVRLIFTIEMTRLSININKFATLRNARGTNNPDLIKIVSDCQKFGGEGITIHPRPDQRHITSKDVPLLKSAIQTEFNIEGNPEAKFMKIVRENLPTQVTLVPDKKDVLTSDSGWDTVKHKGFLTDIVQELKSLGIRSSIFIDPFPAMLEGVKEIGADRVELYTQNYAHQFLKNKEKAIKPYKITAAIAEELELGLNAGHDLNLDNLNYLKTEIPNLLEVSIGHALICDSLYYGLQNTINMYLRVLNKFKD